ncbi:20901_t:CDS:2 [Cetraspora pellucida]|uniref:20901_t:CDS:1 n=1 Tax=Cetraspora pellucida TaxID=1433469 RepID=A0A9N9EFH9_9GLOM|nr:20901_t:CDS:2 [Cetraspora pellucida]
MIYNTIQFVILLLVDLEFLIESNDDKEIELEKLIKQCQNLKNPEKFKSITSISIYKFIKIDNKYIINNIPKIEDIIIKMQENNNEKESKKPIKFVTTVQAIARVNSILDYIKQPNTNIEIDIKLFAKLK